MKEKKKWLWPRLIVLTRVHPEENVLLACKGSYQAGPQRPGSQTCMHPAHGRCYTQANS